MTDTSPDGGLPIGTLVLTPTGQVPVETLRPGALVLAISGASAPFQSVVAVDRIRWSGPLVRLKAEALDDGAPQDDLLLASHHALLLDGALIAAAALIDGHGILEEPTPGPVELVRVTLAAHDAILAAGLAVESARPDAEAPDCLPRRAPDAALRAMLTWRAERMGWAEPCVIEAPAMVGTAREWLEASPLTPVLPTVPPFGADTA